MAKGKKKRLEFYGNCYYCYQMSDKLRTIKFRIGHYWQKDKRDICPDCRKYLKGNFKYARR